MGASPIAILGDCIRVNANIGYGIDTQTLPDFSP